MNQKTRSALLLGALLSFTGIKAAASDTLKLNINKADSIFLAKNLQLLSAKYNISMARALKLQAKVYPNPTIYLEQSLVNKNTRSDYATDPTRTGATETIFQANQLILLAGKRNKQIRLADIGIKMSENDFENVLRTLRFQLHTDICQLHYNQLALKLLNDEHANINVLSNSLEDQVLKGFISSSEAVRIKSLLLEIDKQINEYTTNSNDMMAEINTLLNVPVNTFISAKAEVNYGLEFSPFETYLDSARVYNPDVKSSGYLVDMYKAQYSLNRAMVVPDANVQFVYDKSGNYIRNYYGLGVGISLPAFNRNQGNIRASEFQMKQGENDLQLQQQNIASVLFSNYKSTLNNQLILKNYSDTYESQLMKLLDHVLENYKLRIISLVDFTNYYESYKTAYLTLLQVKSSLNTNIEELNYLIGKPIIKN